MMIKIFISANNGPHENEAQQQQQRMKNFPSAFSINLLLVLK